MKIPRVYLDTSVIGGLHDEEFALATAHLFERFAKGNLIPVVSDLTIAELQGAPSMVLKSFESLKDMGLIYVSITEESRQLAEFYAAEGVLTAKSQNDMLHIATATIQPVDVIVSWNFKHIVNFDKMRLFNAANLHQGYRQIAILSPLEFLNDN
jgi:hypothetical protein